MISGRFKENGDSFPSDKGQHLAHILKSQCYSFFSFQREISRI